MVFDVPDEIALRRAVGRTVGEKSGTQFHQEFDPPPEGVRTGVGAAEKVRTRLFWRRVRAFALGCMSARCTFVRACRCERACVRASAFDFASAHTV